METTKDVIFVISTHREAKKIKQSKIAKDIGVSLRTYQRLESGTLSVDQMFKILNTLELEILIIPKRYSK